MFLLHFFLTLKHIFYELEHSFLDNVTCMFYKAFSYSWYSRQLSKNSTKNNEKDSAAIAWTNSRLLAAIPNGPIGFQNCRIPKARIWIMIPVFRVICEWQRLFQNSLVPFTLLRMSTVCDYLSFDSKQFCYLECKVLDFTSGGFLKSGCEVPLLCRGHTFQVGVS